MHDINLFAIIRKNDNNICKMEFQTDLQFIKGIGPVLAEKLSALLGGRSVRDFLFHLPSSVKFRPLMKSLAEGAVGEIITIPLRIVSVKVGNRWKPLQFICEDEVGARCTIQFFGGSYSDYWMKQMPVGETRIISGELNRTTPPGKAGHPPTLGGELILNHPDYVVRVEESAKIPEVQAVYPLTDGVNQKLMHALRNAIIGAVPDVQEWLSAAVLTGFDEISFAGALRDAHSPKVLEDVMPGAKARARLAFDELFAHQLAIALMRKAGAVEVGIAMQGTGELVGKIIKGKSKKVEGKSDVSAEPGEAIIDHYPAATRHPFASEGDFVRLTSTNHPSTSCHPATLEGISTAPSGQGIVGFELTGAQKRVIGEILSDMAKPVQMRRLVQGDVGSGKTIVALVAMLRAVESGFQAALLAPTDTLAQQHFAKLRPMCETLGVHCEILTGRDKGADRHEKLVALKSGRIKILIGTHALFQEAVEYRNLGLAVIDEQHRFGVNQRLQMASKGAMVDVLALSATPIPRTLSMTIYGDMDVSIIDEKPIGRKPIKTTKLMAEKIPALVERLKWQVAAGAKCFWVCPLVKESELSDFMSAERRYAELKAAFGDSVGLVHGKMPKDQRDRVMAEFARVDGAVKVLVATTVIEVGVDVPQATIMVIESAERFGLAALHQLRGRVGRGDEQAFCVLVEGSNHPAACGGTPPPLAGNSTTPPLRGTPSPAKGTSRLDVLCETDDGFEIAEYDLAMRGVGELLGVKQSGFVSYRFVDWSVHKGLFKLAAREARELVEVDPKLVGVRGKAVRVLLSLFGREEAMEFVKAG
ncbi:MAG: ATP-dependent DNA helicase RecG [Rickettsiales bacterium]|nr:ATP-dependent DNA helicase RecG [Rickettsiales bacterium]